MKYLLVALTLLVMGFFIFLPGLKKGPVKEEIKDEQFYNVIQQVDTLSKDSMRVVTIAYFRTKEFSKDTIICLRSNLKNTKDMRYRINMYQLMAEVYYNRGKWMN